MDCLFCQIISKKEPAEIVYEDDKIIVIKDINPKTSVHLLIIPKKHITSINEVGPEDKDLMGDLILIAKKISEEKKLEGYKLLFNVGRKAGQIIDHIHLHLLAD